MTIIGIDPGFATTGYGVVSYAGNKFCILEYGVIKTLPSKEFPARLLEIHNELDTLISKWKPEAMAVEELFFGANVKTGIKVGHARGVIMLSAALAAIPVFEYTPLQVKLAVSGYGGATKPQVQQMVKILLNMDCLPAPDDAADALAVAICQAHSGLLRGRR